MSEQIQDKHLDYEPITNTGGGVVITCVSCGIEFWFNESQQKFYREKGFPFPKRCKTCREKRKQLNSQED